MQEVVIVANHGTSWGGRDRRTRIVTISDCVFSDGLSAVFFAPDSKKPQWLDGIRMGLFLGLSD